MDSLTQREIEIIQHIASGLTDKEIANKMIYAESSVETFRGRIKIKMEAKNGPHLVAIALRQGIIK